MTTNQFGILLALAAVSQFTVNSIVARFSDTHSINRKVLIISALMMGLLVSIYFIFIIFGCLLLYTLFFKGYSLQQCHNYMHLHVNPLTFHLQEIMLNLPILFYVPYVFFWFLIWSVNRSVFNSIYGICWTFGGTVFYIIIHTYFTNLLL